MASERENLSRQAKNRSATQHSTSRNYLATPDSNKIHSSSQSCEKLRLAVVGCDRFPSGMAVRPNWILRATRAVDKALEDAGALFENRPPPGFPLDDQEKQI